MLFSKSRATDPAHDSDLIGVFLSQAERFARQPLLWRKVDKTYRPISWSEVERQAVALANALRDHGIESGDRVALVSENRPEWFVADLAILMAGAVVVPCYVTNTVADHLHVLDDSGAKAMVVSTPKLAPRAMEAASQARVTPFAIAIENTPRQQHTGIDVLSWSDLMVRYSNRPRPPTIAAIEPDDLAAIIYTSGTGGAPKGVMLSHANIRHNCRGAYEVLKTIGLGREVFLSFLPLSHSYEHTAGLHFPIAIGAQVYFAESLDRLSANMQEARPTIMTAVPRLYETMRNRVIRGLDTQSARKRTLFQSTLDMGLKKYHHPERMTLRDHVVDFVLDRLVRNKVRKRFGGRLKAMVSGGGPLNVEVGLFFHALGVPILQGYGQTESSPVISCNPPGKVRIHTVGPPVKNVMVRFGEDGEILVKGGNVMLGYWGNEKATHEAIDSDGWLHTGDVGMIDAYGYIQITDRKKDIIVNSGGDNISPQRVEGLLCLEAEIAQAMVYGDRRPHLVGLIVPDEEWLTRWKARANKDGTLAELAEDPDLRKALSDAIGRVNNKLGQVEKVRRFMIAPEPFTVDNDQMTPTLKVRRHILKSVYGHRLEKMYGAER
ncbi:long-chain fatty acid--CoA ligase [Roseospira marina]|uniref:Long-chain fatty acid--CoA ligase n=1 Tax=Roseospira marina TaxID=140057 RepID=A0A5M6I6K8_9PROT|nr:long-chain fatty acid--CoA ligase [Roseospira marina]KAA5603507.1 long-chain fatty acid--CoA ligase [Roseospira marina]MBB4315061.1 long-chain acyl-CoA synthetase [Roseospira marina]MBB5088169.1 long-chain acyl-CoA synthetase [Roseospira marina]